MSRRLTKDELDEQFELFLKESVSDDSVDLGNSEKPTRAKDKGQKTAKKPTVSWFEEDDDKGSVGSGRSFLKSLRKSQTIREEEESTDQTRTEEDKYDTHGVLLTPALSSLLGADSLGEAAMLGMDTLEEAEEKERFFAEIEAGASSTIDYSKLNRDLDSTASTEPPGHGKTEEALDKENLKESPGSPHYSDDFEEEEEFKVKEPELEQKPKMSPILAKVSLYDSLDDTREEERKKLASASLDKAQSYAQSGGSDLEALHQALQIHMVQDSEELNRTFSSSPKPDQPQTPSSPPSPPSPALHRPASTNESDLPTAEELLKPIRPEEDGLRGFSLQLLSVLDQTKPPEPQDSQGTISASNQRKPADVEEKRPLSGWSTGTDPLPVPDPPLIQERTWSIRDEVQRFMHDHEPPSAQTNRAKKQTSASSGSFHSHLRRPTAAPPTWVRGRTLDSKTTATSRPSSGPGPSSIQSKSKTAKPSVSQPRGLRSTKGPAKSQSSSERGAEGSDLAASVQSLVSVLQQQINSKHSEPETTQNQLSPTRQKEERSVVEDLKAQLLEKEKLIEKLKQVSEELNSVKQHNYVLQSQLRSAEEAIQKNRWTDGADLTHQERLQQMDKEMKEQETLIKGYQQENERLYQQMKAQQARSKANEDAMFKENQRLLSELAFTREQLNKAQKPVSNLCSMDHSQRISQLLDQINGFQRREERQSEELQRLKQEKQALEVDLQLLRNQTRDQGLNQPRAQDWTNQTQDRVQDLATSDSGDRTCAMEQRHAEEVSELKKRLKWFAENQELLDRDAARLRAATAEILQLKEQVEKLKVEASKRSSEQQRRTRERSADAKRTRDLERQVKELEQILRSRNPNSLPALIFAAASAQDPSSPPSPPGRVAALLERRVQRLEAELEAHDEQAKRTLRAVEQQFQAVRMRYEQQISELEQRLEQKHQREEASDLGLVQSLREELSKERDAHTLKITTLQGQLDSLQQQLKLKSHSSPGRHQRQAEAAFGVRIERLNQELSTKSRTIQDLTRTVERLQRERRSMLSVPVPRAEGKRPTAPSKTAAASHERDTELFPALSACDKTYQPTEFTDTHISEVLQENEALRQKLQQIQSDSEREKDGLQTALTHMQEQLSRLQEEHAQQLSSVQAQSLREQAELRSGFAQEHSESAVAQLTSQINTQQILVQHLQEQLTEAQSWRDALSVSRTREEALQKQLSRLLEDLKEARDSQSPEVKLLRGLERKLHNMETRHQLRDRELQQVIGGGLSAVDLQSEVQRWKRAAQEKTRELDCFRLELDSILDIIRHLQKQGVVLPVPSPQITAPPAR
uniref:Centrosomal protein of 162 kDa n=1 Tax=Neogobius melanostomus TaxID=47308 RepID=A0A8C6T8V0_9GOBI